MMNPRVSDSHHTFPERILSWVGQCKTPHELPSVPSQTMPFWKYSSSMSIKFTPQTDGTHWRTYVENGDMLYSLRRVSCAWNFVAQTKVQ